MTILQVFSRYTEHGGEELAIERITQVLQRSYRLESCFFDNADWTRDNAPPVWEQPWLMIYNSRAVSKVRMRQADTKAAVWLVHNVFPVASAGIFREALRSRIPVIYYIHNFRPFSVAGYLWAGGRVASDGLQRNYWEEIRHGAWQNSRIKTAWLAFVLQLTYKLGWWNAVKAWVAVSDFMRHQFIAAGIPAQDIFTLRHSWRPMDNPPSPRDNGYYLYLGRLIEAKGIRVLLQAWNLLELQLGNATPTLVIAGEGPLVELVRSVCAKHPNVRYVGNVFGPKKFELLEGCRAVIAPSLWWEPLGLVSYEAYDFAKPMLAARSGGLTEVVTHGVTGFIHEPGDARMLCEHVITLEREPAKRMEFGRNGREWLLANSDENVWTEKFAEIVDFAVRSRP